MGDCEECGGEIITQSHVPTYRYEYSKCGVSL